MTLPELAQIPQLTYTDFRPAPGATAPAR